MELPRTSVITIQGGGAIAIDLSGQFGVFAFVPMADRFAQIGVELAAIENKLSSCTSRTALSGIMKSPRSRHRP